MAQLGRGVDDDVELAALIKERALIAGVEEQLPLGVADVEEIDRAAHQLAPLTDVADLGADEVLKAAAVAQRVEAAGRVVARVVLVDRDLLRPPSEGGAEPRMNRPDLGADAMDLAQREAGGLAGEGA